MSMFNSMGRVSKRCCVPLSVGVEMMFTEPHCQLVQLVVLNDESFVPRSAVTDCFGTLCLSAVSFEIGAGTAMTDCNFRQLNQDDEPREESQEERQRTVEQIEDFTQCLGFRSRVSRSLNVMIIRAGGRDCRGDRWSDSGG